MHAVIFDVDGTLIKSTHVDSTFFKQSIVEELGQVKFKNDWSKYHHVTDQGCLMEVLEDNLIPSDDFYTRVEIMRKALDSLGNRFISITYYGDATWDRKATKELGWYFQPVGARLKGIINYHGEADRLIKRLTPGDKAHCL